MGIIQNQALIIDDASLILRGSYNSVKREYDKLVQNRKAFRIPINKLGFYNSI